MDIVRYRKGDINYLLKKTSNNIEQCNLLYPKR
jgi:hypothetical protein